MTITREQLNDIRDKWGWATNPGKEYDAAKTILTLCGEIEWLLDKVDRMAAMEWVRLPQSNAGYRIVTVEDREDTFRKNVEKEFEE
jgi:hypothetical protein